MSEDIEYKANPSKKAKQSNAFSKGIEMPDDNDDAI
jgi:hypothetical protein